jgi:hypothetical protein
MSKQKLEQIDEAAALETQLVMSETFKSGEIVSISERASKKQITIGGITFKAKQVTRSVLTQVDGEPVAITITSEIVQAAEPRGERKETDPERKPPKICQVTNLLTGELQIFICNYVFEAEITEKYPDLSYVGRSFAVESKLLPRKGKQSQLRIYNIAELEISSDPI